MDDMKPTRILAPMLSFVMLAGAGSAFAQRGYYDQPQAQRWQDGAQRGFADRGFQDGTVGADRDFQNHRRPDVNNRDEYRDPRFIPRWGQREYREAFRRAYYERVRQIYRGYGYR
jgi:hypothetical protein